MAFFKSTIILFVLFSLQILYKYCFQFLFLAVTIVPREIEHNTYAKFLEGKQKVLWYFSKKGYTKDNIIISR